MQEHEQERQRFYRLTRAIGTYLGSTRDAVSAREVARYLARMYLYDKNSWVVTRRAKDTHRFRNQADLQEFREWLTARSLIRACYWISSLYSVLVPAKRRLEFAMYFTPPQLGMHVVRTVRQLSTHFRTARIIDPACGGAAFLLPTVALLRRELHRQGVAAAHALTHVETHVIGWERDPVLAYLSHIFLCHAMEREAEQAGRLLVPRIKVVNTLRHANIDGAEGFDIVLCNPPYRKVNAAELPTFRRRFDHLISGQPNLYAVFSSVALKLARPGGIAALLTPTSFVSGDTFTPYRNYLLRNSKILALEMIHEREGVFHGVQQDAILTICERRLTVPAEQRPRISGWTLRGPVERLGALKIPRNGTSWCIPRTASDRELIGRLSCSPWRLKDYGYQAVVGSFVWNRDKRPCLSALPGGALRARTYPVVWATYVHARKGFRFQPRSAKESQRKYLVITGRHEAESIRRHAGVLIQRTSSRGQAHRLVTAVLPRAFIRRFGGFVAENHVIVLEPNCAHPPVSLSQLHRVLQSQTLQDAYAMASGTSAVTIKGLSSLALPDPSAIRIRLKSRRDLERAVRSGYVGSYQAQHKERAVHATTTSPRTAR
jgi:adenine-specific DNA-methyltransferase